MAVLNLYCGRFGLNSRNSGRSLVAYADSFNCLIFLARNNQIRPATAQSERRSLMVSWLEALLMVLFVAALTDAATRQYVHGIRREMN